MSLGSNSNLDSEIGGWLKYRSPETRYELLALDLLDIGDDDRLLLDCGSGNGRFSFHLLSKHGGLEAVCLDLNKQMVKSIHEWTRVKRTFRVNVVRASMTALPFRKDLFDAVLNVHNLWYAQDYEATCHETMRVCKGRVVMDQVNLINPRALLLYLAHQVKALILRLIGKNTYPLYYRSPKRIFSPFKKLNLKVFYNNSSLKMLSERFLLYIQMRG